jgi:heavy metal sensor kinase
MKRWWQHRRLRIHLTLWYVSAMVVILALYATGVLAFVSRRASASLDARIRADYVWAAEMWDRREDGSLTWYDPGTLPDEDSPWLQVWTGSGDLLFSTSAARRNPIPGADALALQASGQIVPIRSAQPDVRVLSRAAVIDGQPVIIQVAQSEALIQAELTDLAFLLLVGLPAGVAAAGLGGYLLARRALRPVDLMAERARSITAAKLDERLPVDEPHDELGRLATVFNDTLARLEGAFGQMARFTGDVSHELRTPLTAIRTVGEVSLREPRDPKSYQHVIESMLEETDRLSGLVDRLLLLSRAESGHAPLTREAIDLAALAEEVAGHLGVLAEERNQRIVVDRKALARVVGDRVMLRQALINLVDNAIKYSPSGSVIRIGVDGSPNAAIVEVQDSGAGIAPDRREHIFDRFYRGASHGLRDGAGLGLNIAKWTVEANLGQLAYEPRTTGGSTFRITLPAA